MGRDKLYFMWKVPIQNNVTLCAPDPNSRNKKHKSKPRVPIEIDTFWQNLRPKDFRKETTMEKYFFEKE